MRRITCLTDFALALFCMLLWVPLASGQQAQARIQPGTIYICSIKTDTEPSVLYRSGVFHVAANTSLGAINDAFQNYLRKNYHIQFSGSACMDMLYDPDGRRYIQAEQGAKNKREIVIVDWKYVPGQDTPPPPQAAPIVASGKGNPSYCFGYNGNTGYFSDIFEVPPHTPLYHVMEDFARFVIKKYGLEPGRSGTGSWDGGVNCPQSDNKDPDKRYGREKGYKIIETGWKPKSLPPPNRSPA